jgi:serine/threonine-protein kinase
MAEQLDEFDDISFGQIALFKGMVTREHLREVVEIQNKLRAMGLMPKKVGEILLEKDFISPSQVNEILAIQKQLHAKREIAGYEILEKLGQGGMGTVYKARQKSMERIVALKILPRRLAKNKEFIQRFLREAQASAKLNHENIITGIDVGESHGYYYFAMEYADGETVDKNVLRDGPMDETKAVDIVLQVARALDHAHKSGLVHRDVKPQNIILTKKGVAKLCDLGLAKQISSNKNVTQSNVSVGTPHYISPEQAKGEPTDIRSDIYSLGATFYHMVTGGVPFKGSSPLVVMTKHLTEEAVYPQDKNPNLSRAASDVIMTMMAKNPAHRYHTPEELIAALEDVKSGRGRRASSRVRRPKTGRIPAQAAAPAPAPPPAEAPAPQYGLSRRPPSGRLSHSSGGRRRSSRRGRAERGEFRASRARSSTVFAKSETFLLLFGVAIVLVIIGFMIFQPKPAAEVDRRHRANEQYHDDRDYNVVAYQFLHDADLYRDQHPYDIGDQEKMYLNVISKFPGTPAAKEAAARIEELKKERGYGVK